MNTGLTVLCGAFLAGSLFRSGLVWGLCLVVLGGVVLSLLAASSVESLPTVFQFNPVRVAKRVWETSDYGSVLKGALTGVPVPMAVLAVTWYLTRRSSRWQNPASALVCAVSTIALLAATMSIAPSVTVPTQDITESLNVPPGFDIEAYLPEGSYRPTAIAVDSQGRLYMGNFEGVVSIVDDLDGDGAGDEVRTFIQKGSPALGLAISPDDKTVYIAGGGKVLMVTDEDHDGVPDSEKVIIDDLPSFTYDAHSNNGITIGPDGKLYMTLGGTSDHGPENHPLAGAVLTANNDGSGLRVYAPGLRNSYDLAFDSKGTLIATDNQPDVLDTDLTWEPPEELNIIREGENYGYPDVFGFPPPWSDSTAPIALFPSHSVATGVVAYSGEQFPSEYQDKIFVTLFGPLVNPKYRGLVTPKVVVVTLVEPSTGGIRGSVEDFALGLKAPIDVAVDKKGHLYVADYAGHMVYRVSWAGQEK